MTHPLVTQLRFSRSEFERCLDGISAQDAVQRIKPMNCISWMVGHLAGQEQFLWVEIAQGKIVAPGINDLVGFGKPASTPPMDEMWGIWLEVTTTADQYLNTLTPEELGTHLQWNRKPRREDIGTTLLRNIFHYWFHTGEAHAVRQMLGHTDLPQFVGNMSSVRFL